MPHTGALASLVMKIIGKPYVGKTACTVWWWRTDPLSTEDPRRARSWKQRLQPRIKL